MHFLLYHITESKKISIILLSVERTYNISIIFTEEYKDFRLYDVDIVF